MAPKSMWPGFRQINGPSPLPIADVPADMRGRRLTGVGNVQFPMRSLRQPRFNGLGNVDEQGRDYPVDELNNGPSSLSYADTPIDMYPRPVDEYTRNPDGTISSDVGGRSALDQYLERIAKDTDILASVTLLKRGLFGRTVEVTTTPQLIVNAEFLRGYIFLNPNELAGATAAGTLLASTSRGAATADLTGNSATLGVANFLDGHFYINVTAVSGGALVTIVLQALDPTSGTWIDVQDLTTAVGVSSTYAYVGSVGVGTDLRVRWSLGAGDATFSVGYNLKNGLAGTSAGLSQTIFLGGPEVSVESGFPLLNGQSERFFLQENVQLWAVANATLPFKIFEL